MHFICWQEYVGAQWMLPLVIIKQKPNFQKWNIQKAIVCILGRGQGASFPKSAAPEEAGQGPIPRAGAFLGPGKWPLGPCFLLRSLYVVENLSRFDPSESFFPHRSKERESHGKWSPAPSPNLISHCSELAQLRATEGIRQTKEARGPGPPAWGPRASRPLCTGGHCTLAWKTVGTSGSLSNKCLL